MRGVPGGNEMSNVAAMRLKWLTILALALVACGSSDAGSADHTTSNGPIPATDYPAAYAAAYCNVVRPCCDIVSTPFNEAGCRALIENVEAATIADPNRAYDPAAGGRCVKALAESPSCDPEAVTPATAACEDVYSGTIPTGGACDPSSLTCAGGVACVNGVCAPPASTRSHAGSGAACDSTCDADLGEGCDGGDGSVGSCFRGDGLVCLDGTCAAPGQVGDPCTQPDDPNQCVTGAVCDALVCRVPSAVGGPCGPGTCVAGAKCDFENSVCVTDTGTCDSASDCADGHAQCLSGRCVNVIVVPNDQLCTGVTK